MFAFDDINGAFEMVGLFLRIGAETTHIHNFMVTSFHCVIHFSPHSCLWQTRHDFLACETRLVYFPLGIIQLRQNIFFAFAEMRGNLEQAAA